MLTTVEGLRHDFAAEASHISPRTAATVAAPWEGNSMMSAMRMARLATVGAAIAFALSLTPAATAEEITPQLRFQVTGEAQAAPDMATISVGVSVEAKTAEEAMAEQAALMSAALEAAKAAGVAEKDIQTSGLSLFARYSDSRDGQTPTIVAYRASNQVSATVRDISKVGETLDALVAAGANEIGGVSFGLQDPAAAEEAARKDALKRLAELRDFYAADGALTLGRMLRLEEVSGQGGGPMFREQVMQSRAATPVAPGELTISVTLSASYEITE